MAITKNAHPQVLVGHFPAVSYTRTELANLMAEGCSQACEKGVPWLPNGHGAALAGRSPEFMDVILEADIDHADGMPVAFASKMASAPLPERIPTADFFHDAARAAEENGLRFSVLGASEENNDVAVAAIRDGYRDPKIAGGHLEDFGEDHDEAVCEMVREDGTDVGGTVPHQPLRADRCLRDHGRLCGVGWLETGTGHQTALAVDAPRRTFKRMQTVDLRWCPGIMDDSDRFVLRLIWISLCAYYRLGQATRKGRAKTK